MGLLLGGSPTIRGIRYCERGSTSTADLLGAYLLKTGAQKVYYQVAYLLKTSGLAVH